MYEDIALSDIDQMIEENKNLVGYMISKYFADFRDDEDIRQCGFIGLWKACRDFDAEKGELSTIACRMIHNEIIREINYRRRKRRTAIKVSLEGTVEMDPDKIGWMRGDKDVLYYDREGLLSHVTPRQRKIIELREEGYKYREVGKQLGISTQMADYEVKRVRAIALQYIG